MILAKKSVSTQCNLQIRQPVLCKVAKTQTLKEIIAKPLSQFQQTDRVSTSDFCHQVCLNDKCTSNVCLQIDDKFTLFPFEIGNGFRKLSVLHMNLLFSVKLSSTNQVILEITKKGSFDSHFNQEPFKYVCDSAGIMKLCVLFIGIVNEFSVLRDDKFDNRGVSKVLLEFADEKQVFCTGLGFDTGDVLKNLSRTPSNMLVYNTPAICYKAKKCEGLFLRPNNVLGNCCVACKGLARYLKVCVKRRNDSLKSPVRKRRIDPSSTCRSDFLSPESLATKRRRTLYRYRNIKTKVDKLKGKINAMKITLNNKQHEQMKSVTRIVKERFSHVLDEVLTVDDMEKQQECRELLRETYDKDCKKHLEEEKAAFFDDQTRNVSGSKGNRWNLVTYRLVMAVACRSKAAYEALQSFKFLNLPSWRSIQRKTAKNLDKPGVDYEKLQEQKSCYDLFVEEQTRLGFNEPKADGVLIFDEVNVAAKVVWNSKNHEFMGLAMPSYEYPYLQDLYEEINPDKNIKKSNYMLQFLWRDLTANYDIIGPYFALASTADIQFTLACLIEVLKAFQFTGFNVASLVCDGASSNLSVIKLLAELYGTFSFENNDGEIDISINPSFPNPFNLDRNIYFIICPSHQLKNMINALFSSDPLRAKKFLNLGVEFGWKQIVDLKARDDENRRRGVARKVPQLLQSFVERDSWTKLNVKPARILQQNDVLSAIYEHANPKSDVKPEDYDQSMATFAYLKACQNLFEKGMLSKTAIKSPSSDVIHNIREGLNYFSVWLKYLLREFPDFNPSSPRQKLFISFQTWSLLRIMVFGMEGLVKEFFQVYKDNYYLCPLRINGSAVETLFSQIKHNAGGKVSGVNFSTARKNTLTNRDISGHHSGRGYRDTKLYFKQAFQNKFGSKKKPLKTK